MWSEAKLDKEIANELCLWDSFLHVLGVSREREKDLDAFIEHWADLCVLPCFLPLRFPCPASAADPALVEPCMH